MTPETTPYRGLGSPRELWLMVGILTVAAFLRFYAPDAMPPGPSHDELRMMDLGELIVEGQRPIHWTISYSAEPSFMYLLAVAMPAWGFTPFGARLVTRFAGVLLVAVAHRFTRRLFGRRAALFTSGVLSVTWWPLFFSRVALRGITLPLTFTGGVICLWRGLRLGESSAREAVRRVRWGWLVGAGALMGLTWYTFTAARGLVVLLPAFLVYLGLLGVFPVRRLWRIVLVTVGAASVVAGPFIYEMQVHPGAPETRLDQLSGIIDQLMGGNLLPFARQTVKTAGLFVATGDPNWRYNISGRPAFGPVLGVLSVFGIMLCVKRWRQPRCAVLILWLLLGMTPSFLTPEAPSFVRGIGALPVIAVFPAVGAVSIWDWIVSRARRDRSRLVGALLILTVSVNGLATFRDSFADWIARPEVQAIYQASLTKAFRDLSESNLEGDVWISEPFPDDRHLLLAKRVLTREPIEPRWFDAGRALVLPPAGGSRRYLLADFVKPDDRLLDRWMSDATVIMKGRQSPSGMASYRLIQAEGGPWVERQLLEITARSTVFREPGAERPVALPARFGDAAEMLGYELSEDDLTPGENVNLTVYWRVQGPVFEPIASFAHLLDAQNAIVGQYDGFDVPPWEWESGAVVAQVYRFAIDREVEPGPHWLEVGVYDSHTMERLDIVDERSARIGNRLVLQRVTVE
ncbi:MAG: hypothetical protein PVH50_00060 [Anaerolineae bacterium]